MPCSGAGKVLAEGHALPTDDIDLGDASGQGQRSFQRIRQTAPDALTHGKAVHHDLHRVLDVLFQRDLFVQVIQIAVDPHTGIAAPPGGIQLLLLRALALAHHRSQHLKLRTSSSLSTASTISSTVCWLITRPHTGQWGTPTRAYRSRR